MSGRELRYPGQLNEALLQSDGLLHLRQQRFNDDRGDKLPELFPRAVAAHVSDLLDQRTGDM